jgi:hypothetical protein
VAEATPPTLASTVVVHRIGGGVVDNLRLKPKEEMLTPPGISVLLGGSPAEAAEQMREAFPDPRKFARLHEQSATVGSASVEAITAAGFVVVPDGSKKFPNHARITHPEGAGGFSDANLDKLAAVFQNSATPGKSS